MSSGVSSGSGLTPLNPIIDHTYIYVVYGLGTLSFFTFKDKPNNVH
jgi:hypothetical protein